VKNRASERAALGQDGAYVPGHVAAVRAILTGHPGVREGRMFGYPAFFVGKRMFACAYGQGVGVKLPADRVCELLKRADILPFRPHGKATMHEWVQINHTRSEDYAADRTLVLDAMHFVSRLQKGGHYAK
jgi:hypothetical protein